jgi:hypothetical protein
MINKLKTFAIAILVTGATVTSTRAATASSLNTNTQVLDNISVQLTVYSQGGVNSSDKSLAADKTTIKTADIIYQLGQIGGFTVDAKKDKLVLSTTYTNQLAGVAGSSNVVISTVTLTNDAGVVKESGMYYWQDPFGDDSYLDLVDGSTTNSYLITNGTIYLTFDGTTHYTNHVYDSIGGTNALYTSTSGFTLPFNTSTNYINLNAIPAPALDGFGNFLYPDAFGYFVTVVTTVTGSGATGTTNVTITQYSPGTEEVFAQKSQHVCVMTPKSGSTEPTLTKVDNWVAWDMNGGANTIYAESGKDLSTNDFSGTNITGETTYSTGDLLVYTTYPAFGAAATVTNLNLDPGGFSKGTAKLMNFTVHGKATNAEVLQIISSANVTASGQGYIGGSFVTNASYISSIVGNVTNYAYNAGIYSQIEGATGNFLGTNFVVNTNAPFGQYVHNPTEVVYSGTVTLTFLSSGPEIQPVDP